MASTALPTQASTASTAWIAAVFHAGMSNHIRVCKINDDHIIFVGFDCFHQFVTDSGRAHLRLKVVGRNLGGFYQDPVLPFVRFLHAAVEEEGHMCILLGLRDAAWVI